MSESPTELRSRIMRAIKGQDTGPELIVRKLVWALGFRYRLHRTDLPGKPDLAFIGRRKVIFVHGCFWHGHDCPRGSRVPKTNSDYWRLKVARNKKRDADHLVALDNLGWKSQVIWECELKRPEQVCLAISRFLR
jgi:DNA mismatch endonuclease (patch repair protein)